MFYLGTNNAMRLFCKSALAAVALAGGLPSTARSQIGWGGNQPAPNAVASAYRIEVRNRLNQLVIHLAEAWDTIDPKEEVSNLYAERGTMVLGASPPIEGRKSIKAAFAATLRHMRGVLLTIDEYDLSGELAFVRGTMVYEILHENGPGTQETAGYTMILRRQRNDQWLIESHMIAGDPVLPEKKTTAAAGASSQ